MNARTRAISLLVWCIMVGTGGVCSAQSNELIDKIVTAWKKRTAHFSAVDCRWVEAKTSLSKGPERTTSPVIRQYRIMFSPAGTRVSRQGPQWHPLAKKYLELPYDCAVYHGEFRELMQGDYEQISEFPQGYITRRGELQNGGMNAYFWPMIMAFRPLEIPLNGIDPRQLSVVSENTELDGRSCVVLSRLPAPQLQEHYWLDPSHDFVVRRYERTVDRNPETRLDITYDDDPDGCRPLEWIFTEFEGRASAIRNITRSEVNSYAVPDAKSQEWIQIPFPPRTLIINLDSNARHLVRDNGEWRVIDPEESAVGVSYKSMLTTDPPSATARTRTFRYQLIGLAGLLIVVAVAVKSRDWARRFLLF